MKKLFLFTLLIVISISSYSQSFPKLEKEVLHYNTMSIYEEKTGDSQQLNDKYTVLLYEDNIKVKYLDTKIIMRFKGRSWYDEIKGIEFIITRTTIEDEKVYIYLNRELILLEGKEE